MLKKFLKLYPDWILYYSVIRGKILIYKIIELLIVDVNAVILIFLIVLKYKNKNKIFQLVIRKKFPILLGQGVFFSSEANDLALRLARDFTKQKDAVILDQ